MGSRGNRGCLNQEPPRGDKQSLLPLAAGSPSYQPGPEGPSTLCFCPWDHLLHLRLYCSMSGRACSYFLGEKWSLER